MATSTPTTAAQLRDALQALDTRITAFEGKLEATETQLATTQAELAATQAELAKAKVAAGGMDPAKVKVKLEQPDKYGGDRDILLGWITAIRNYIDHNSHQFATEESKTRYAATRFKDQALKWFAGTLDDYLKGVDRQPFTKKVFENYSEFEEEVTKVFESKDEKRYAQERLSKLRQTKLAMVYAAMFRQDSIRAEINEKGLKKLFYNGLKEDVKDELY